MNRVGKWVKNYTNEGYGGVHEILFEIDDFSLCAERSH